MAGRVRCYVCNDLFFARSMRLIRNFNDQKTEIAVRYRLELNNPAIEINDVSRICINCDNLINRDIEALLNPESLRLKIIKQKSTDTCMICNAHNNLHRLSDEARIEIYMDTDIYIPLRSNVCLHHLDDSGFLFKIFYNTFQSLNRPIVLNGTEITRFLTTLRSSAIAYRKKSLDLGSLSEENFRYLTSLTKVQFNDLYAYCDPVAEANNSLRYVSKEALVIFLFKMHHGLSDQLLSILFNYSTRQSISMLVSTVRQSLNLRFVPENIGLGAINREQFIARHVTPFANELYNENPNEPKAIAIVDGTYSYVEKFGNYRSLRQSYSIHKGRHLVKPVLLVASDGYILDIHGPYFANARNNDANILRDQFERDVNNINQWFQDGDIFIVDRGYRDAVQFLENRRYNVKMPPYLEPNQRQLTTEMANTARLITMQRWVVESRNGHIKSIYKLLDGIIPRAHVLHLKEFYLIAGALLNKYRISLQMVNKSVPLAQELKGRIIEVNVVQARVEAENLARRNGMWEILNEGHVHEFPRLELEYIKQITHGPYQLKLAPAYIQDKFDRESTDIFQLDRNRDEPGFLRFRIYSRFRNATRYQLWISFRLPDNQDDDIREDDNHDIQGYYCTCKSGARTIGCCAHIASVLWFLGWARHQQYIKYPSEAILNYVEDAGNRNGNEEPGDENDFIVDVV